MKRRLLIVFTALSFATSLASAADPQATDPAQEKAFQQYLSQMQAHMTMMQAQMQKLQQSKDPKERQQLMQDHWAAMQEGMKMMHGTDSMPGCMMMGGHMMGGPGHMMGGDGQHMMGNPMMGGNGHMMGSWWNTDDTSKEGMDRRMQMMGACMGIQQQMMDQMMQSQTPTAGAH